MKTRKDAWTKEDDQHLMETVMEYVKNGDTKASAYKKAGEVLGRTASACAYRWNVALKHNCDKPSESTALPTPESHSSELISSMDLNQVIDFLSSYKDHPNIQLEKENRELAEENNKLNERKKELEDLYQEKKRIYQQMLDSYETVSDIFNKAKDILDENGGEKRAVH